MEVLSPSSLSQSNNSVLATHQNDQNKDDIPLPLVQNYFEDRKTKSKRYAVKNQRERKDKVGKHKGQKPNRNTDPHKNRLPKQLSLLKIADYRQIYRHSEDIGLKTLRLLTLNSMIQNHPQESIKNGNSSCENEQPDQEAQKRRSSLKDHKTNIKFEAATSKDKVRPHSAPTKYASYKVCNSNCGPGTSHTKEKRINLLDKKSYKSYCGLLSDFLNPYDIKTSNKEIKPMRKSDEPSKPRSTLNISQKVSKKEIENNLHATPRANNSDKNISPSLSLSEIVLSANNINYNGLEYHDPTTLNTTSRSIKSSNKPA